MDGSLYGERSVSKQLASIGDPEWGKPSFGEHLEAGANSTGLNATRSQARDWGFSPRWLPIM